MSTEYTATVKAVVPQLIHCVSCNFKSVYEQTVTGRHTVESGFLTSEATAQATAEQGARDHLMARLNDPELCNAIPCRHCYRYQPYMHKLVAQSRYNTVGCMFGYLPLVLGVLVALVFGVLSLVMKDERRVSGIVAGGGLLGVLAGCLVLRRVKSFVAAYDPNEHDLDKRKKLAEERALPPQTYDEMQTATVRDAYNAHVRAHAARPWAGGAPAAARPPRPWARNAEQPDDPNELIVSWYVEPALFSTGGAISVSLSATSHATVLFPDTAQPGDTFPARADTPNVHPFKLRLLPIRVHPEEQRLE